MKNGLLSIGEFAKLRGINVKSLRYYESIGALRPAYVNPDSGYRYYSINQLSDLDVVLTLIELGIPLKTIASYTNRDGQPVGLGQTTDRSLELLEQGKRLAQQRIERAQAQLIQLEDYANEINLHSRLGNSASPYRRRITRRFVLCAPLKSPFSMKEYATTTDNLYRFSPRAGLVPLFTQGILFDPTRELSLLPSPGESFAPVGEPVGEPCPFAFLQAQPLPHSPYNPTDYLQSLADADVYFAELPEGTFSCKRIAAKNFDDCFDEGMRNLSLSTSLTVLAEAWAAALNPAEFVLESQHLLV